MKTRNQITNLINTNIPPNRWKFGTLPDDLFFGAKMIARSLMKHNDIATDEVNWCVEFIYAFDDDNTVIAFCVGAGLLSDVTEANANRKVGIIKNRKVGIIKQFVHHAQISGGYKCALIKYATEPLFINWNHGD